jgi:hypothetical protein
MTAIANTVAKRLTYKAYSTASITPGTEADYSSDPGATGGQVLRYTGTNMNLQKGIFKSAERRQDRQRVDLRHGGRKAPIQIDGELSCLTYQDLIAAVLRGIMGGWHQQDGIRFHLSRGQRFVQQSHTRIIGLDYARLQDRRCCAGQRFGRGHGE